MNNDEAGTNRQAYWHQLVSTANLVKIRGQCPGSGIRVVGLQGGTAPGRVAITISEQGSVVADNGDHDGVVDEAAQNGAVNLSEKHDTRGDFDWSNELAPGDGTKGDKKVLTIFAHLEVIAQVDGVKDDIV